MKTSPRLELLKLDERVKFPTSLTLQIHLDNFGEKDILYFEVPPHVDLNRFIYDLINPFKHPQDWPINGDNYRRAIFKKCLGKDDFPAAPVLFTQSMKTGLIRVKKRAKMTKLAMA